MTAKHTPGPWTVLPDTGAPNAPHFDALVMTPNGALGYWDKKSERWHLKAGDAALIASAHDLLAERDRLQAVNADLLRALKEATRCLAWHEERHGVAMDRKAVEDARAIIARVEL